jgi:signal transduction histidine kinase
VPVKTDEAVKEEELNPYEEVVLVCADARFCREMQRSLQRSGNHLRVVGTDGLEDMRRAMSLDEPSIIVIEERALTRGNDLGPGRPLAMRAAISLLTGYAPVVMVGCEEHRGEISELLAVGIAEFVARSETCEETVAAVVEKRLQQRRGEAEMAGISFEECGQVTNSIVEAKDLGGLLRHELNNPLTGILGNAELLLVELKRKNIELPAQEQQRLETIAALAVRMRETVRKLSDMFEAQAVRLGSEEMRGVN